MGKDHAGRFSGMVYVRLRSAADLNQALRKQSEYLCGRQVILQRLDPGTPNIFRPIERPLTDLQAFSGGRDTPGASMPPFGVERPWPSHIAASQTAERSDRSPKAAGVVKVNLSLTTSDGCCERSLVDALVAAPIAESLAAIRNFLTTDVRLPGSTRRAIAFMHNLRLKLLDGTAGSELAITHHAFRSPFESAGVMGYTLPEVEAIFGTRSSDSVFWPIFQTFHTVMPHQVDDADAEDSTLEDFLAA